VLAAKTRLVRGAAARLVKTARFVRGPTGLTLAA
jgi:hypothetical protein